MAHFGLVALEAARTPALSALWCLAKAGLLLMPAARQAVARAPSRPEAQAEAQPEGERTAAKFEVRALTALSRAELREATTMLAHAFDDGPLFRAAFPHAATRRRMLHLLFGTVLKDAVRCGRVEVAHNHKIVGMLIWYPPGRYPMSAARILRLMPDYARMVVAAPAGLFKLFRAQAVLNRFRPKAPHCHGYFLGGRQGEHVGGVLAKRLINPADAMGVPIYLETQERRSVKLYARLGFKMLQDGIETLPGGPHTWTMWREPQTPAQERGIGSESICPQDQADGRGERLASKSSPAGSV